MLRITIGNTRAQKTKQRGSGATRKVTEMLKFPMKEEGEREERRKEEKEKEKEGNEKEKKKGKEEARKEKGLYLAV